jgi:hypothetical protein
MYRRLIEFLQRESTMANIMSLAQVGEEFNTVTSLLEGGVSAANQHTILNDLQTVQTDLTATIKAGVASGLFADVPLIHIQNVDDQLNIEIAKVHDIGVDPLAPKEINDVHRDIIDIVQGDAVLVHEAKDGFGVTPVALTPAAQFVDNVAQTAFLATFTQDSIDYNNEAPALIAANAANFAATGQMSAGETALLAHIRDIYLPDANTFVLAQGGLYTARFDNELGQNGVADTAGRAMIDSLQHGNFAEAQASGAVLVANAMDVNGNNLAFGATPIPSPGTGIPATFDTFAQVGAVFNDATVKLIGGIYDNSVTNNHAGIVADLTATSLGLQQVTTAHPALFTPGALGDVISMEGLINTEIKAIGAAGLDPMAVQHIHDDQLGIIALVQGDPTLQALAASTNGFQAFAAGAPITSSGSHDDTVVAQAGHHHGHGDWHHA